MTDTMHLLISPPRHLSVYCEFGYIVVVFFLTLKMCLIGKTHSKIRTRGENLTVHTVILQL